MTLKAMQERYTVKKYADKNLNVQDIEDLKEILRLTPSSINAQPWRFVFVQNHDKKEEFAKASKFNEPKIVGADTLVIFQIMTEDFFNQKATDYIPERTFAYYQQEVTKRPGGYPAWAARQAYIAMGVLLAACAEKQIGSTPMEGINPEEYDQILGDKNYRTLAAVSIGVPSEEDPNRLEVSPKQRRPIEEVIKVL